MKSPHFHKCEEKVHLWKCRIYLFYLSSMLFLVFLVFVLNSIELFFAKFCVIRKGEYDEQHIISCHFDSFNWSATVYNSRQVSINSFPRVSHFLQVLTKVKAQEQMMTIFREDQSNSIEFSFNSLSKDINHTNGNEFTQYYSKKMSST